MADAPAGLEFGYQDGSGVAHVIKSLEATAKDDKKLEVNRTG
jgi:hypothetical protein